MLELERKGTNYIPKIMVIGVGGGGNNAIDRMIDSNIKGVTFIAVNTDAQVLYECKAEIKLQIGMKLTNGYGAGADPGVGEAAAIEDKENIKTMVEGGDLVIITCGMGGGTGTGATPVIARCCQDLGILTVAVVTTPFSFESYPRMIAATTGVTQLKECVDTLLVIPNDKLLAMSEHQLFLKDAFAMADSVLRYSIESITNIIYNRGIINLDFNDLKTTLTQKGIGHLGIGSVEADGTILEAVKQAINSSLLDTSIVGASNILINSCGNINLISLNEALSYVREIVGESVNIIWGTVTEEDFNEDKVVVTMIATGMPEEQTKLIEKTKIIDQQRISYPSVKKKQPIVQSNLEHYKMPITPKQKEIIIPPFLTEKWKK